MRKNKINTLALALLPLTFSSALYASDNLGDDVDGSLSFSASLGQVSARSLGSNPLNWKLRTPIIGGEANYDLLSWLSLNARGWTAIVKSTTSNTQPWSQVNNELSFEVNKLRLTSANELDFSIRPWLLQQENTQLGLVGGYQRNSFGFISKGGCYNNGQCIDSKQTMFDYRQTFSAPYIGLAGKYMSNNFELNALVKFSNWATARTNDQEYFRNLNIRSKNNVRYYGATVNAGYNITEYAKVFVEGTYNQYSGKYKCCKATKIGAEAYTVSAGLKYQF